LEIGVVEGALARFFQHRLTRQWRQGWHNVVARFASNQDAPHGPGVADTQRGLAALAFGWWAIREIRAVGFFGVDDRQSVGPEAIEESPHRGDNGRQRLHVVAQGGTKSTGFQKVALHIDDYERQAAVWERVGERGGSNGRHRRLL